MKKIIHNPISSMRWHALRAQSQRHSWGSQRLRFVVDTAAAARCATKEYRGLNTPEVLF